MTVLMAAFEVTHAMIMSRYPRLTKFFFEWADIYDASFDRQECHLSSRLQTFPSVDELVAWATEGFLMACWLSLQDHVYEVKYMPYGSVEYHLRKGRLGDGTISYRYGSIIASRVSTGSRSRISFQVGLRWRIVCSRSVRDQLVSYSSYCTWIRGWEEVSRDIIALHIQHQLFIIPLGPSATWSMYLYPSHSFILTCNTYITLACISWNNR
jgi:hypothetical protein